MTANVKRKEEVFIKNEVLDIKFVVFLKKNFNLLTDS